MQPFKREKTMGINEQMYHAQVIANYFTEALQESSCLNQAPVSLFISIDSQIKDLRDTKDALNGEDSTYGTDEHVRIVGQPDNPTEAKPNKVEAIDTNSYYEDRVYNNIFDNCIDCFDNLDLDIESLSAYEEIFSDLIDRTRNTLSELEKLWNEDWRNPDNYCYLIHLLSYQCIPDLTKILAALLARIALLLADINLGDFALSLFISGIISGILKNLLSGVTAITNASFRLVYCLIDSLMNIYNSIPTQENVLRELHVQQRVNNDLSVANNSYFPELDNPYGSPQFIKDLDFKQQDLLKKQHETSESIKDAINQISSTLEESVKSTEEYTTNLLATVLHIDCENKRTGVNIFETISKINELVMITRLVAALIQFKSKEEVLREICGTPTIDMRRNANGDSALALDTAIMTATVIQDAFDASVQIVESEDGDLSAVIKDTNRTPFSTPDLYGCNMQDFAEEHEVRNIIKETVAQVNETLVNNDGIDPKSILYGQVSQRSGSADSVIADDTNPIDREYYKIVTLDSGYINDLGLDYKKLIDDIIDAKFISGRAKKIDEQENANDIRVVPDYEFTYSPEEYSDTDPNSLEQEGQSAFDLSSKTVDNAQQNYNSSSVIADKDIKLKCGSINNIMERFNQK